MKCTFYRPEKVDLGEWNEIRKKLLADLKELESGAVGEKEVRIYLDCLLRHAEPLEHEPRMSFFGFDKPDTMPSDARVDFFYWPGYIAAAVFMRALTLYPRIAQSAELTGQPGSLDTAQAMRIISSCLLGCTGRRFEGDGFRGTVGQLEAMFFFTEHGAQDFFKRYPELCPEFEKCYTDILERVRRSVERGEFRDDMGSDVTDGGRALLEAAARNDASVLPRRSPVFVYGTLMSGQSASDMMNGAEYLGNAVLRDHVMYGPGSYPGIVPRAGETVLGEVYIVDNDTLRRLDGYEGEGSLYTRAAALTELVDGRKINAYVYLYNGEVSGEPVRVRWNMRDDEPVWYACYGSNISAERFSYYILGGTCPHNGKPYDGCADKTLWKSSMIAEISGRMYFGNHSRSWQGGVSFFLPGRAGKTVMRLYLITFGQLKQIQEQEGPSEKWYGRLLYLFGINGIPVYTLTSEQRREQTEPGEKYLSFLREALINEAGMSPDKAEKYLKNCAKPLDPVARKRRGVSGKTDGWAEPCRKKRNDGTKQ
jgi:gamma-glutamylcyclotransferase (GGCT)/AIG2-like uncharacterized protein YtfP